MFKKWWTFNLITEYNVRKFTISDIKNTESILGFTELKFQNNSLNFRLYRSLKITNDNQVVYMQMDLDSRKKTLPGWEIIKVFLLIVKEYVCIRISMCIRHVLFCV